MGLDFMVYKVKRNSIDAEDADQAWGAIETLKELAYGRKSWELVQYLNVDVEQTYSRIDKKDWDSLIANLKQVEFLIRRLNEFDYDKLDEDEEADYEALLQAYAVWHSSVFDRPPYLSYDFSVGYMLNFLDADVEIQKAFADEDSEVWGFASY